MKLLFVFGFYLSIPQSTFADETCYLADKSQLSNFNISSQYPFGDKTLFCTNSLNDLQRSLKTHNKSELKIIRAHYKEIKSLNILASFHGYHLINQAINCEKSHCNHIQVISLDDFNNIKEYTSEPTKFRGSNEFHNLVNEVNPSTWLSDIVTLSSWSRVSGSSDNNSAKTFIENRFNALNLQVTTQSFNVNNNSTNNIIGMQLGATTPDDWYIVGAHMDSIPSSGNAPGAVDNASGCAGVLELARIASGHTFSSSILFICYSGEEQGLIGSSIHVNSIIANGDQNKVKAVLTMDMIGYTSNSDHELLIETSASNQWLLDVLAANAAIYAPQLTVYTSTNPFGSDHVPYINNNMHGILSIDDDWNVYPDYHQNTDLPENINNTQGDLILKTNLAALAQLAGLINSDIIFKDGFD